MYFLITLMDRSINMKVNAKSSVQVDASHISRSSSSEKNCFICHLFTIQ